MDVDNLHNVSFVKFDDFTVQDPVAGILVNPLLKCIAVYKFERFVAPFALWVVADGNRHCEFVVLGQLKFGEEGYRQCWNGSLDFGGCYCQ